MFFAYDTSAGSGFALSGGSDATYHLRVIEHILTGGGHMITDSALNYPYGGLNYNPPLFDWTVAAVAYPLTLFGLSVTEAASAALAFSTAFVGALTCIPVYLMVREMFSRRAAIIASAFFALSSVAIIKTVFSNGTESAFYVFFFVLMTLFLLRAVKALKKPEADAGIKTSILAPFKNKAAFRNLIFAALSLAALELSWIGFLSVIMLISFIMVVQAVLDRLRGVSAAAHVSLYASVMLIALLIGAVYYGLIMGMTMLIAGPICLALLLIAVSLFISCYRVWVISMPVSIIVVVVVMTLISLFASSLFGAMVSEAYPYVDGKFGSLLSLYASVTLSTQAIYAGMMTMWFSFIVAGFRLIRLPKKMGSPSYLFITMWFVALLFFSWRNVDHAYLAAPMYAAGTGVVVVWVLSKVNLKAYFANFKGSTFKSFWKKLLKPIPFATVLIAVFMLLLPNVLYAVDASIPSNTKGDISKDMQLGATDSNKINYLGATNYYIKDSDWTLQKSWDYYSDKDKDGALVTWLDYGAEAIAKGGFNVVSDIFGGGSAAASNILLGTQSGSVAAMALRLILYEGALWDDLKTILGDDAVKDLELILFNGKIIPDTSKPTVTAKLTDYIRSNPDIYGPVDFNISEENAKYLAAVKYLTGNFTDLEVAKIYAEACKRTGNKIGYIGVTGNMLPVYYGDSSTFSTLAFLNDYYLDKNGAPSHYYTAGVPNYGYYYTYNDAIYETMLWKSLVGMSLEDYKAMKNDPNLSASSLLRGLMLSDGTYKAYPGFGLSNFELDKWWVMYNPGATEGDVSSDNWTLVPGKEAQERQAGSEGGLINYLGGMAFLKYVESNGSVSGTVTTDDAETVAGVTVAIYDPSGNVIGVTKTNEKGEYGFMVDPSRVKEKGVYSGSVYAMEIDRSSTAADPNNIVIAWSEVSGTTISGDASNTIEDVRIELKGKVAGKEYSFRSNATGEFSFNVVPDTYTVTMTLEGASVYTGTFTLYPGKMELGDIDIKSVETEITVKDSFGNVIPDAAVEIWDTNSLYEGIPVAEIATDDKGVARTSLAPGQYTVQLKDHKYDGKDRMLVSSSSTTATISFTATLGSTARASVIMVACAEVTVEDVAAGDVVTFTNGAYTPRGAYTLTIVAQAGSAKVFLPIGDYDNAKGYSAVKTALSDGKKYYAKVSDTNKIAAADWKEGDKTVTVTMTYKDGDGKTEPNAGIVSLINDDGLIITIPVSVPKDGDAPFTAKVPEGKYTVYAYAYPTEKKAFIGKLDTTAAEPEGGYKLDILLKDAIAVSGDIRYTANTTIRPTFVPIKMTTEFDGVKHTIWTASDSVGAYYMMVPKGNAYYANTELLFGYFMRSQSDYSVSTATDTGDRTSRNITVNPRNTNSMTPEAFDIKGSDASHTIAADGKEKISAGGVDIEFDAVRADGKVTMIITNKNATQATVKLLSADLTFTTTATWLTSVTGGVQVTVPTGTTTRTVNATFAANTDPTVNVSVDASVYKFDGVEVQVTAINPADGKATLSVKNTNTQTVFVIMLTDKLTLAGTSVTAIDGGIITSITSNSTRTINATFDSSETLPISVNSYVVNRTVKAEIKTGLTPIGDPSGTIDLSENTAAPVVIGDPVTTDVSYEVKDASTTSRKATVTLTNNHATDDLLVRLFKKGVTFEIDTVKTTGEVDILLKPGETNSVKVDVTYSSGTYESGEKQKLDAFVRNIVPDLYKMKVTQGSTDLYPDPTTGKYELTPGTCDILITPPFSINGYKGFYYSGRINVYAGGQTTFDIEDLIKKITTIVVDITKDDTTTVMHKDGAANNVVEGKDSTETKKIYYIPTDELSDYIIKVENDDTIAYIDLGAVAITSNDIVASDHAGKKATLSGYVGRSAGGTMKIEMSVNGTAYTTVTIPVSAGEYSIVVPLKVKVSGTDHEVKFTFSAEVTDTVKEEKKYFTGKITTPVSSGDAKYFKETDGKTEGKVNMEVELDTQPLPDSEPDDVTGKVKYKDGSPMEGVTVSYTIDNNTGSATTDINGNYVIPVSDNTATIKITGVTKSGYVITPPAPPLPITCTPGTPEDFEMSRSVEIEYTVKSRDATDPTRAAVEIELTITNNLDTTAVISAGSIWSSPIFNDARNYAVIPAYDGTSVSVIMKAYYNSQITGAGSEALSVIVKDLLGTALQTKTLDIYAPADTIELTGITPADIENGKEYKLGDKVILTVTAEGNRVSKNEYGFAVTFTNSTDKRIKLNLNKDPASVTGWFIRVVDQDNMIIDPSGEILLNGNSTAVYYVRMISLGVASATDGLPKTMHMEYTSTEKIELNTQSTDLSAGEMSAAGNNIFDSLAGMPMIVWVFAALCILMMLLIFWLGLRRGVFVRKR
jgi:asparagine N-glycosylation enzyme membrane subunit Stt3